MNPKFNPNKPACEPGEEYDDCLTVGAAAQRASGLLGGSLDYHENLSSSIQDLITDLLHLCDRQGHVGRPILNSALNNWEAERDPQLDYFRSPGPKE